MKVIFIFQKITYLIKGNLDYEIHYNSDDVNTNATFGKL